MAYELIMNARANHPISIQLIIVSREKTSPTQLLPHPPKTHESREVQPRGLAYRPTESSFNTYEKWIILRVVCANSLELRTDAGCGAREFRK